MRPRRKTGSLRWGWAAFALLGAVAWWGLRPAPPEPVDDAWTLDADQERELLQEIGYLK